MGNSQTEPTFMKFLCSTIETLALDCQESKKSMKSKQFETNLEKGGNLLTYTSELS